MFIIDSLIGNWDRHNGNWGFLYNTKTDEIKLAPVYDCGSCLYPNADDKIIESILKDENEMNFRIFEIPTSAILLNGKKIKYFEFISSLQNEYCNSALKRITPRINIEKIKEIINNIPVISELQKNFYIKMIEKRKELILDYSLKKLKEKELNILPYNQ